MGKKEMFETGLSDLFAPQSTDEENSVTAALSADEDWDEPEPVIAKDVVQVAEEIEQDASDPENNASGQGAHGPEAGVQDAPGPEAEGRQDTHGPQDTRGLEADGPENQWVVFRLGSEEYGLDISSVDSVIRLQSITAVPGAPSFVEGVTNLRGTVLPVVDLHKRLGLEAQETTGEARIVVAEVADNRVGMLVDAVVAVHAIPSTVIEPPSPLVAAVDATYISGIAKVEDERLIVLLDLQRTLASA